MASVIGSERPRRRRGVRSVIAALGAVVAVAAASADARADTNAADKAAAETLFDEAKRLVKERKYAEACPKFAESLRLDTGIGTMLYLADCFEKNGQSASAWAQFREAAGAANAAGQFDREKKARARAAVIEPKLSRLSIGVSGQAADIAGLEVKRDGVLVSKPLWGSAVPVDPGDHVIEASAPGRKKWSTKVTLVANAAATSAVEVPLLERETGQVEPPRPDVKGEPPRLDVKAVPSEPGATEEPPTPPAAEGTSAGRVVGFTLIGLGAAGLATGGVTGVLAILTHNARKGTCKPNGSCVKDEDYKGQVTASRLASVSTISLIAGGAVVTGGLITVLATRKGDSSDEKKALHVSPLVGAGAGGLLIEGVW
jgi:hypothetical protein